LDWVTDFDKIPSNSLWKFLYLNLTHTIMIVTKGFVHDDDGGAKPNKKISLY